MYPEIFLSGVFYDSVFITGIFNDVSLVTYYAVNSTYLLDANLFLSWTSTFETTTGDPITQLVELFIPAGEYSGQTSETISVDYGVLQKTVSYSDITPVLSGDSRITGFTFFTNSIWAPEP